MKIIDGYGEVEPDLWVFDNAAIYKGKEYKADKDNIVWVPGRKTDGIRTITCNQVVRVELPKKCFSLEEVIENLCKFWNQPRLVWLMLGYASATIFFRPIAELLHCFAVFFAYGPTDRGKTYLARVLTSLCGGTNIISPTGDSTAIGMKRHLSRTYSIPVVSNEFKGAINENIIRSLFDLDPHLMGIKSMDSRTLETSYHTSGLMTAKYAPREKDVVNRCIMVDLHDFYHKKDKQHKIDFINYFGKRERNAGFLKAVLKSDAQSRVINEINDMRSFIIDRIPEIESRQLECYSVVFGSLYAVGRALGLREIFEKFHFPSPNPDNLVEILQEMHYGTTELMQGNEEMTSFFELIDLLMNQGKLQYEAMVGKDKKKKKYLRIHLPSVLQEVKKEEALSGVYYKKLAVRTSRDISKILKITLGVKTDKLTSVNGRTRRHHTIYISDIKRVFGYDFTQTQRVEPEKEKKE